MQRSVLFAVVSYSSMVEWDMTLGLHRAATSLAQQGWKSAIFCAHGMADLCRARNGLFAAFVDSGMTDMLCIDADVSWQPGTVERILSHPVDLVFGAYPLTADGAGYAVRGFDHQTDKVTCVDPVTGEETVGGLVEVQGGPAGFLRITKRCAEKLIREYDHQWYVDESTPLGKAWDLCEFKIHDHKRRGEDIEFCSKWQAVGEKVWLDPWLMFEHHGKKSYRGCIGNNWGEIQKRAEVEVALDRRSSAA
jgi:hypothetical protein